MTRKERPVVADLGMSNAAESWQKTSSVATGLTCTTLLSSCDVVIRSEGRGHSHDSVAVAEKGIFLVYGDGKLIQVISRPATASSRRGNGNPRVIGFDTPPASRNDPVEMSRNHDFD